MSVLQKLVILEQEAVDFGFKWDNTAQIMQQIKSECAEIEEHLDTANKRALQEEIGDLLHAVFSLAVFCNLDAKETLELATDKFARRLQTVKALAAEQGLTRFGKHSCKELMVFWDKAKEKVG